MTFKKELMSIAFMSGMCIVLVSKEPRTLQEQPPRPWGTTCHCANVLILITSWQGEERRQWKVQENPMTNETRHFSMLGNTSRAEGLADHSMGQRLEGCHSEDTQWRGVGDVYVHRWGEGTVTPPVSGNAPFSMKYLWGWANVNWWCASVLQSLATASLPHNWVSNAAAVNEIEQLTWIGDFFQGCHL